MDDLHHGKDGKRNRRRVGGAGREPDGARQGGMRAAEVGTAGHAAHGDQATADRSFPGMHYGIH